MMRSVYAALALLFSLTCLRAAAPVFEIPRLDGITIDGKADDWGERGFRANVLTSLEGDLPEARDHSAVCRLGWNDAGLLLLATVRDDAWIEAPQSGMMWGGDGIEVYLAPEPGHKELCQWVIGPGMTAGQPAPRWHLHDWRTPELAKLPAEVTVAREKIPGGYVLEALLPLSAFGITPALGRELGMQFWVNDNDPGEPLTRTLWYPGVNIMVDHNRLYPIRLADKAGPGIAVRATGGYDLTMMKTRLAVVADGSFAGRTVRLRDGRTTVVRGTLTLDVAGRATFAAQLPLPAFGKSYGPLRVEVDGETVDTLTLPNADRLRAEAFMWLTVRPASHVFSGYEFPPLQFEQPSMVEQLIGPYRLSTTYYDANYRPVTTAETPGRYGAVTTITTADGRTYRRFVTLCRVPQQLAWYQSSLTLDAQTLAGLGLTDAVMTDKPFAVKQVLNTAFTNGMGRYEDSAITLAALLEAKPGEGERDYLASPWEVDRQWWVGLKRKLYGWEARWPQPFVAPRPNTGAPAPVLREGTLAEAGMKPDAATKIDAVLTEWSKDTDEAFNVCIARHGVIVLEKAYGTRNGKPLTIDDTSVMASSTKMLSGTMLLMLVDQSFLALDDEAGKYLPPLASVKTNAPFTIRRLYNHTNGFPDTSHWEMKDMEERMSVLVPHLAVGKAFAYNGTGMEMASKIVEAVSGESLGNFYRTHLFTPLGMTRTSATFASFSAESTPREWATFCQMLLNKGAYGDKQFLSEAVVAQIKPRVLSDLPGEDAKQEYGVGTYAYGNHRFGHGGFTGNTVMIDEDNDMVILMNRNGNGRNFDKYHPLFLKAIEEGIAR